MSSWPELWSGMKVSIGQLRMEGLTSLYSIHRFSKVTTLDLEGASLTSVEMIRLLQDIPGKPLNNLNVVWVDLRQVQAEILARAISSLQQVDLSCTRLNPDQSVKVVEAIQSSDTLVDVKLQLLDHSEVPALLLARAVCRLKTVDLSNTRLNPEQCVHLVEAIQSSKTLVNVIMVGVDLGEVPAQLLAGAVGRLKTVDLSLTKLKPEQCVQVVEAIQSSKTLVDVIMDGVDLRQVPAPLLARAVGRLKTVDLSYTKLKPEQCVQVVEAIESSKTLVGVNMFGLNLRQDVSAEVLASLPDFVKH